MYWFRTPPGIKVGRAALDEDAIRLLEELNPDVEFDWTRMFKAESPAQEPRAPVLSQGPPPQQRRHGPGQRQPQPRREREPQREPRPPAPIEPPIERVELAAVPTDVLETTADPAVDNDIVNSLASVPDTVADAPSLMPSAAQARLGTEGIVRLRGRHAEILARIGERIADAARREELKLQAERLNPDSWVTDEEVRVGLEQYEAVFESLRSVVGRRRKRRRRRGGRPQGGAASRTEAQDAAEGPDSEDPGDL